MTDIVDGLIRKGQRLNDGDYTEAGIIHCGVCKAPKQMEIDVLGKMRTVPILCECEKHKIAEETKRKKAEEQRMRIQSLREVGIADPAYLKWRLETDDGANDAVTKLVRRYIDNWEIMKSQNMGLMFYGGVGTGKSWAAAAIANAVIDNGDQAVMTNIPMLINAMTKDFGADKQRIMRLIGHAPLLVLDDLGVERDTSFGYEQLQEIIDARYRSDKPLIVTTNLSQEDFRSPKDVRYKRVYDRVLEMCRPVMVDGKSRRAFIGAQKRAEAAKILGV